MTITDLDQAIKAVCPIDGVSCGNLNDRKTWSIQFTASATKNEIAAANNILNTFIIDVLTNTIIADPIQEKLDILQQQVDILTSKVDQL